MGQQTDELLAIQKELLALNKRAQTVTHIVYIEDDAGFLTEDLQKFTRKIRKAANFMDVLLECHPEALAEADHQDIREWQDKYQPEQVVTNE